MKKAKVLYPVIDRKGRKGLLDQTHEVIMSHILDPENSHLPDKLKPQLDRVYQAAKLLDDYPLDGQIVKIMLSKYSITPTQARKDIALARQVYKSRHDLDWDFWFLWQVKDLVELINTCKRNGDTRTHNDAHKTLRSILGNKPEELEDQNRMESNQFYIQINNGQSIEPINVDLEKMRKLSPDIKDMVIQTLYQPIDNDIAEDLMNS